MLQVPQVRQDRTQHCSRSSALCRFVLQQYCTVAYWNCFLPLLGRPIVNREIRDCLYGPLTFLTYKAGPPAVWCGARPAHWLCSLGGRRSAQLAGALERAEQCTHFHAQATPMPASCLMVALQAAGSMRWAIAAAKVVNSWPVQVVEEFALSAAS